MEEARDRPSRELNTSTELAPWSLDGGPVSDRGFLGPEGPVLVLFVEERLTPRRWIDLMRSSWLRLIGIRVTSPNTGLDLNVTKLKEK